MSWSLSIPASRDDDVQIQMNAAAEIVEDLAAAVVGKSGKVVGSAYGHARRGETDPSTLSLSLSEYVEPAKPKA